MYQKQMLLINSNYCVFCKKEKRVKICVLLFNMRQESRCEQSVRKQINKGK